MWNILRGLGKGREGYVNSDGGVVLERDRVSTYGWRSALVPLRWYLALPKPENSDSTW